MTGGAREKGSRHDLYDLNTTNQTPSRCVSLSMHSHASDLISLST